MAEALLEPAFVAQLSQMALANRRRAPGLRRGEQRSTRRGQSLEFADHRPYTEGDDLRHLDWHLYARLDDLFIKLFEAREDRAIQFYIDTSASMRGRKLLFCQKLVAALGYLALAGLDRVSVHTFSDRLGPPRPSLRGKAKLHSLLRQLEALSADGATAIADSVRHAPRSRGGGMALILSDFMDPAGYEEGLKLLSHRRMQMHVIHVFAPEELDPPLKGDLTLVDRETGREVNVTVTPEVRGRYRAAVDAWCEGIEQRGRKLGAGYQRVSADESVRELVLHTLRRRGWLR